MATDDNELTLTAWHRSLRAANRSEKTITIYLSTARQFADHVGGDILKATKADIQNYLASVLDHRGRRRRPRPGTAVCSSCTGGPAGRI